MTPETNLCFFASGSSINWRRFSKRMITPNGIRQWSILNNFLASHPNLKSAWSVSTFSGTFIPIQSRSAKCCPHFYDFIFNGDAFFLEKSWIYIYNIYLFTLGSHKNLPPTVSHFYVTTKYEIDVDRPLTVGHRQRPKNLRSYKNGRRSATYGQWQIFMWPTTLDFYRLSALSVRKEKFINNSKVTKSN